MRIETIEFRLFVVSLILFGGIGNMSAAEKTTDWEGVKAAAIAEKDAIDAQVELLKSRRSLEAEQNPVEQGLTKKIAAAQVQRTLAEAQTEAAKAEAAVAAAREAGAQAKIATFKAAVETIPTTSNSGSLTLGEKAGEIEASLLAAQAINQAAEKISKSLPQISDKTVLICSDGKLPKLETITAFQVKAEIVEQAFSEADKLRELAGGPALKLEGVSEVTALAGLSLDAVNRLLGFFRTDYSIGGISLVSDDTPLIYALAGVLLPKSKRVQVPALSSPRVSEFFESEIFTKLKAWSARKATAILEIEKQDALAAELKGKEAEAQKHREVVAAYRKAASTFDAVYSWLTAQDSKGEIPLTNLVRENTVESELRNGALILAVKINRVGGAYYTKRNLWTFFGGMPLFHMGGAVTSYALLDGKTGDVIQSGLVPVHGGFFHAKNLQKIINGSPQMSAGSSANGK